MKLVFHLPNGRVLTGVGAAATRVGQFKRLPRGGLFLGACAGDVGGWAVTTGRINTSSIVLGASPTGTIVGPSGAGECPVLDLTRGRRRDLERHGDRSRGRRRR